MAKISPGTGLDDGQKAKIVAWRKSWRKAADDQKASNLTSAGKKKDAHDGIVEAAERMGIPPRAFRMKMKELDHLDKANGVRGDIEDDVLLDAFDKMSLAIPAQSVFDFSLGEPVEAKKPKKDKKDTEAKDDKVTTLADHREPAGAVA